MQILSPLFLNLHSAERIENAIGNHFVVIPYDALIESAFRLSKENFGDKIDSRKCASGKDRSNYL